MIWIGGFAFPVESSSSDLEGAIFDAERAGTAPSSADLEPQRLDEDRQREEDGEPCSTCERVPVDGDPTHWVGCPEDVTDNA